MKKKLLLAITVVIYIVLFFPITLPISQPTTSYSTIPDSDADYLVSLRIFKGEGLYSSFSILYPPGRFLLQALLYKLITPSYQTSFASHVLFTFVLFPPALFVLNFLFSELMFSHFRSVRLKKFSFYISYVLSVMSVIFYLDFLRSAQEIHFFSALFFIILLSSKKLTNLRVFVLGVVIGLIFLFRLDGGFLLFNTLFFIFTPPIFLYLSFQESESDSLLKHKKPKLEWIGERKIIRILKLRLTKREQLKVKLALMYLLGFGVVWVPTLLAIGLHGSLYNFFYDTFILGLQIQPKFMSLPIPQNELRLVWLSSLIFLSGTSLSILVDSRKIFHPVQRYSVQIFAVFATVSYVAALGRADEPHLWYGLVWFPILLWYVPIRLLFGLLRRQTPSLKSIVLLSIILFAYCSLVLQLKSPSFFLFVTPLLFILLKSFFKSVSSILIATVITTLLVFHSVSYLKLRFIWQTFPSAKGFQYQFLKSEGDEIGGMVLGSSIDTATLIQLRTDIPADEKYLFIFPKNVVLDEYLHLQNPTRYIILMNERSDWTEQQVMDQLLATNTKYYLIFPESAKLRQAQVWDWILEHTTVIHEYQFSAEPAQLRMLK